MASDQQCQDKAKLATEIWRLKTELNKARKATKDEEATRRANFYEYLAGFIFQTLATLVDIQSSVIKIHF